VTIEDRSGAAIVPSGELPFGVLDERAPARRSEFSSARLIPYNRWAQDGPTAMRVFLPVVKWSC